jgi:radical SAM protein with 4Fe4S-binding SPASM domain
MKTPMKTNFALVTRLLSQDPGLAVKLARSFATQKMSMEFDHRFLSDTTHELGLMYFRLTPLCNLHCVMCGQRGVKGVLKGSFAAEEAKKIVPLEIYKRLVDEIKHKKPTVYLWGGEPFLYPELFPLVDYMIEAGLAVSINTNGTYLAKYAEEIVKRRWHAIFVSLDGFEETNDKIRGEGSYRHVVEGFEAINREKKRQSAHLPHMGIVTTVSNLNYKDLYRLADAARGFELSWHIFNLGTYTNQAIIKKQRDFMREKLDTEISCLPAYATGFNEGIDGHELHDILTRIHSMECDHPIITVPALNPEKIQTYYGNLETPVRAHCSVPWSQANIDYDGGVHFCADYPDYKIGNIKDQSFFEIFNGKRARCFRRILKESPDGIFPGCVRCYQNMLCGKKIKGY